MRWHNVLLLAAAILISGCKEEKLAVGAPPRRWRRLICKARSQALNAGKEKAVYLNFGLRDAGGA